MKVILLKNIDNVGRKGDIINVKNGFARNYLLPKKLADEATALNLKSLQHWKQSAAQSLEKEKQQAQVTAQKLDGRSFTIAMEATGDDKLYGSITQPEIADILENEGIKTDKKNILLDEPLKTLGIYQVDIRLHPEVITKIKIWIVRK